jgi:cell division protein FtsB
MGKRKKRKKRKEKKSFKLNIVSLLFCAVAFYMIFTIIGQRRSLSDINDKKDAKLLEKAETEMELQEFREDYEKINDPEQFLEIVEKIARDEYKMVKPYETVYIDKNKTKNKFIMGIGTE